MKHIYQIIVVLFCSLCFASCGDDDFLEIDSLSADGDEFFCNQKVKVWMCVNSSDLWHTTYEWSCDGGSLTQPQGLNEMTWKAPSIPGTYTITCKATVGDISQTRVHKMYVSSYYFEKFEKNTHSMTVQSNVTQTMKKESNGNQFLQVQVNSSAEMKRYVRRSFGDTGLYIPFSIRMRLGFVSNPPTTQRIKVGKKEEEGMLEYRWNMRSDASNNGAYINQIRLRWFPNPVTDGYPIRTENDVVEGTPDYNVQLIVQYTSTTGAKVTYNAYHKLNTLDVFAKGVYKNVSMSVDENDMLYVHVGGAEILASEILKNARIENACEGRMSLDNWEFYFVNGVGAKNIPQMFLDDAYGSSTEILK